MSEIQITRESANHQLTKVFAPWVQSLNLKIEAISKDEVIVRMPYSDDLCRSHQIVCGQAMMALIDTTMVFVCYAAQGNYGNCTTVSQNTSFMRAVKGQDVIAKGKILKAGRQLVFGEVMLYSAEDEKLAGSGIATYMLLPG